MHVIWQMANLSNSFFVKTKLEESRNRKGYKVVLAEKLIDLKDY